MDKICKNMEKYIIKLQGFIKVSHKIGTECLVDRIHTHTFIERNMLKLYNSQLLHKFKKYSLFTERHTFACH